MIKSDRLFATLAFYESALALALLVALSPLLGLAHTPLTLGSLPTLNQSPALWLAAEPLVRAPRGVMILATFAQTITLTRLSIFGVCQR